MTAALAAVAVGLAWRLESFVAAAAAAHLLASLPVWLAVLLHELRRAAAQAEALEERRLAALAREGRRPIFGDAGEERPPAPAAAALERGRRVGAALAGIAVVALEALCAWALLALFPRAGAGAGLPAAAALCGGAFALLVIGRYAARLAGRDEDGGPLAAGGRRATSGALLLLVAGLALAASHAWGLPRLDLVGYAGAAVSGLLALEGLLLLVLEVYRPRRPGEAARPVYDSRLLGLLSAPADLARSIARTVDYQFGFALSQTWFYRFLERWVAPLIAFALVVLWALSSLVVVGAHERALVRRLGTLREGVLLEPGLSFKLPWPIDEAIHVPVERVHSFMTGRHAPEPAPPPGARERTVLWTEAHAADEHDRDAHGGEDADLLVLLARRVDDDPDHAPVNLLQTAATLTFRVRDARAFVTHVQDARALLEVLAERELSFMLSGADLDELLVERGARGAALRARVQAAADAHGLGVEVTAAHLTELHPPPEVGPAFEAVTAALERREAAKLAARAHAERVRPAARAEADRLRREAQVAAEARIATVLADAERFEAQRLLDRAAPGVFRLDRYLRALVEHTEGARKVVVGSAADVATDVDLEEKVSAQQVLGGAPVEPPPPEVRGGGEGR